MNRLGTYLPHTGADAHPVLPREPVQNHPGGQQIKPLTWPTQYLSRLRANAHTQQNSANSFSDYALETPADISQTDPVTRGGSPQYHKLQLTLPVLLDALAHYYNTHNLPGTALKEHFQGAQCIQKYLSGDEVLNQETRMSICATAHRLITMLTLQSHERPDTQTIRRFIEQSCLITFNTDQPKVLLAPLVSYFQEQADALEQQRTHQCRAARHQQDIQHLQSLSDADVRLSKPMPARRQILPSTEETRRSNFISEQLRALKAARSTPFKRSDWLTWSINTLHELKADITNTIKCIEARTAELNHHIQGDHQTGLDTNYQETLSQALLLRSAYNEQFTELEGFNRAIERILPKLTKLAQALNMNLLTAEEGTKHSSHDIDVGSIWQGEHENKAPYLTQLRADPRSLWLPSLIAQINESKSQPSNDDQLDKQLNNLFENEAQWNEHQQQFLNDEIHFLETQLKTQQSHQGITEPSQIYETLRQLLQTTNSSLDSDTLDTTQDDIGSTPLTKQEATMRQWLNMLDYFQSLCDQLPKRSVPYGLIEAYMPVIAGAIVRLEYEITTDLYTEKQEAISRDLGDQRSTSTMLSATLPTPLPIHVSGGLSCNDNRDETASVNRLTQSEVGIGLGAQLGSLQISSSLTGKRLHWYIYNTVKDFALALAEQDLNGRVKKRLQSRPALPTKKRNSLEAQATQQAFEKKNLHPFTNPQKYLQLCRTQKQDPWSARLEKRLTHLSDANHTHHTDYSVTHLTPKESNYMELTQHFLGVAGNLATLAGATNRSNDSNYVYTPYYELFENNSYLLDDKSYIFSEKIPEIWDRLKTDLNENHLTETFHTLEDITSHHASNTTNLAQAHLNDTTRQTLKAILFSAFIRLKLLTDRFQTQHKLSSDDKAEKSDQIRKINHWRQLQAECARLKRIYNSLEPDIHSEAFDPHVLFIGDLEKYIMQPRFNISTKDYVNSFFAQEVAHGHTINYLDANFELPIGLSTTGLVATPRCTVNRYDIENCGIPNLDGQYCDFSISLTGKLSSNQITELFTRSTQIIGQHLARLPGTDPTHNTSLSHQVQESLAQVISLNLTANGGLKLLWRFNKTEAKTWEMQYRVITSQTGFDLGAQSVGATLGHLGSFSASVSKEQDAKQHICLGDNTMKHIYRRFHSPYGFNKFWAWWQFLVDFRQQITPILHKLNVADSTIRFELDQLCQAIRTGIRQKGSKSPIDESVLDERIQTLNRSLNIFAAESSTEQYQHATLALTNLLALDFEVLYFDKLLASYTLHLPKEARNSSLIKA